MLLVALALAAIDLPPPRPMAVEVSRDPITDQVRASANLYDSGQRLTIACDAAHYRGVRVSFTSSAWLSRGNIFSGERPLIYRFDQNEPRRHNWTIRDRAARLSGRGEVAVFVGALIGADLLVFRTRDVEEHRLDLSFRIVGARPAVAQLLDACGETRLRTRLFGAPAS
jgi:hypothetical protein